MLDTGLKPFLLAAKSAIVVIDSISDYLALTQIGITIASLGVGWLAEDAVVQSLRLLPPGLGPPTGVTHAFAISLAGDGTRPGC